MSDDLSLTRETAALQATLRQYTNARVALGRSGAAVPTAEQLRFQLDHALARDAIHTPLDVAMLLRGLKARGLASLNVQSAAGDRKTYLLRPDLGRTLHADAARTLESFAAQSSHAPDMVFAIPDVVSAIPDVVFVITDGLSALAVERHALPLLDATLALLDRNAWRMGPVVVATLGRVAIGDAIGSLLRAQLTITLIGERPGLSTPDSLGVYITWQPRPGRTDAERNCISNVHHEGVSYADAAARIIATMNGARRLQATGVQLKINATPALGPG